MALLLANLTLTHTFNDIRVRINEVIRDAASEAASNFSSNIAFSGANVFFTGANVTFSSSFVNFASQGGVKLPSGTTAQRVSASGVFRFNTENLSPEWHDGTEWHVIPSNSNVTLSSTFNAALANTNAWIATKANTTTVSTLTSTVATKYAVANVEARFVTNTVFQSTKDATNLSIAKKYAVANVEAKFISNTVARATFLSKTSATEQTVQPSVVIANTFIAQKGAPIKTVQSNTYTLLVADNGKYIRMANTGGVTITIPTLSMPLGAEIIFVHSGGNTTMTFANSAGVRLNSLFGRKIVSYQYSPTTLKNVGTNEYDLAGV